MQAPAREHNQIVPPKTASIPPVPWTPVLLKTCNTPQPFTGSDGKVYVAYDVVLNNFAAAPSSVLGFEVLDANGKLLHSFSPHELSKALVHPDQPNQSSVIPPGGTAVLAVNLSFDREPDVPDVMVHRISAWTNLFGRNNTSTYEAAPIVLDRRTPVVIGSPVAGGKWICSGGYGAPAAQRDVVFAVGNRLQSAQYYAIDLIRLDEQCRATVGDRGRVEDNASYGQTVYAVADGTIRGIKDGLADQSPVDESLQEAQRSDYPEGNAIVQDIGNGLYVLYAHLKPGSLKVKDGQRVKKGSPIALVGNSGDSTSPHLRFQVMDAPHPLAANGMPFLMDHFTVFGEVRDAQKIATTPPAGTIAVEQSRLSGEHKDELPQAGLVVIFPEPVQKPPPKAPPRPASPAAPNARRSGVH